MSAEAAAEVHEFVGSSNLKRAEYREDAGELRIEFSTGGKYAYREVTRETFDAFKAAPSAGRFFASDIKGTHPCEKLS